MAIHNWIIRRTPLAIVDVETTGGTPGPDRIVEIAVVRVEPWREVPMYTALNTLIQPERPVGVSRIHGITDQLVANAPTFDRIAAQFVAAVSGTVVVAYGAEFAMRFLRYELGRINVRTDFPYICAMHLRPMIGDGPVLRLKKAAEACEIKLSGGGHFAHGDARAVGQMLLDRQIAAMVKNNINTFGQLPTNDRAHFIDSFGNLPLSPADADHLPHRGTDMVARTPAMAMSNRSSLYLRAVSDALSDKTLSDDEIAELQKLKTDTKLSDEELRAAHAYILWWYLGQFAQDSWLSDTERDRVTQIYGWLKKLGWAPGEP